LKAQCVTVRHTCDETLRLLTEQRPLDVGGTSSGTQLHYPTYTTL